MFSLEKQSRDRHFFPFFCCCCFFGQRINDLVKDISFYTSTCPTSPFNNSIQAPNVLLQSIFIAVDMWTKPETTHTSHLPAVGLLVCDPIDVWHGRMKWWLPRRDVLRLSRHIWVRTLDVSTRLLHVLSTKWLHFSGVMKSMCSLANVMLILWRPSFLVKCMPAYVCLIHL